MDITKKYVDSLTDKNAIRELADKFEIKYSGNTGMDTLKDKILTSLKETPSETPEPNEPSSLFDAPKTPETLEQPNPEDEKTRMEAVRQEQAREQARIDGEAAEKARVKETERLRLVAEAEAQEEAERLEREEAEAIEVAKLPAKAKKLTNAQLLEMDAKYEEDPLIRRRIIRAKALRLIRVRVQNLNPSEANVPGEIITIYTKYTGKVSKLVPNNSDEPYHIPHIIYQHLKNKKFVVRKEIPGGRGGVKKYKDVLVRKYSLEVLPNLTREEIDNLGKKQVASGAIDN